MQVPATTQSRIQLCNMTIISLKLPQEFLQALEQMETCAIQMKNPVVPSDWSLTARENLKPGSNQSRHNFETRNRPLHGCVINREFSQPIKTVSKPGRLFHKLQFLKFRYLWRAS